MSSPKHFSSRSRSSKKNMKNPETREKIRIAQIGKVITKETRNKLSSAVKRAWNNPGTRKRYLRGMKKYANSQARKEKMKPVWESKEWKSRYSLVMSKTWKSKAFIKKITSREHAEKTRTRMIKEWKDPIIREKRLAANRNSEKLKTYYNRNRGK